jgi:hypothetical protein
MHPALWQLIWFDLRGAFRGLGQGRRSLKRIILWLMMLACIALFIGSQRLAAGSVASVRFGDGMPFWALTYLAATWLTAYSDRGLIMRPAELHFVAGGPFRQRDIISLNLFRLAYRSLISSSVLALLASAYVPSFLSSLVGIWLLIGVSLLVGMLIGLAGRSANHRFVRRLRRLITAGLVAAIILLVVQSLQLIRHRDQAPQLNIIAATAGETPIGQYLIPPLKWMFAPISAHRFVGETLPALPARLSVIGLLVAGIYVLSSRYVEASATRTEASMAKRQQALRSGTVVVGSGMRRLRLPLFDGLTPTRGIAWMQLLHAMRILPRYLLYTSVIVGVVLVIPIMLDHRQLAGPAAVGWMAGLTMYADFLLLLQLPVGFLGPTSQRELYKSLPIPAWRIVLGLLAGPLLPVAVLHLIVLILFLILFPAQWQLTLTAAIALLPAALVIVANINLLGSWNIIRPRALQQRDALAAGRAMLSVWIFFAMLTPAGLAAGAGALLASWLLARSPASLLLGAAAGATAASMLYILVLARSFDRWQPTTGESGNEEVELNHA